MAVEPGSDLNLSAAEMERFAALHKKFGKGCSKYATCSKAVMEEYRSVLEGRSKAYQAGDLQGIGSKWFFQKENLRMTAFDAKGKIKLCYFEIVIGIPVFDTSVTVP